MVAWERPEFLHAPEASLDSEMLAGAQAPASRPWVLFVGEDETTLRATAAEWIKRQGEVPRVAPSSELPLSIAAHQLLSPGLAGERLLYLERLDRAFFDTLSHGAFSASSPLYLIPLLASVASEGEPLGIVATAVTPELEARAPSVLAQRGLSSRFEIRRVAGGRYEGDPTAGAADEVGGALAEAPTAESCLALGLASRDPVLRARAYERALALDPSSGLAHLFAASSLLERRRLEEARQALARALELETFAAAYYEIGKLAIQTDDIEGALAAFRKTTELLPEYPSAWGNLGAALGELQRLDEAAAALARAVALDPLNPALHSNLGVTLRDQGRLSESEQRLREAVALAPDFVFGHYNLANVLYLMGRYPEAIESFQHARSLDASGPPRQYLLLAVARLASGDLEGALQDYRGVFDRLDGPMRDDMRRVAEWDLKQLAERVGVSTSLREAAALLRRLA